jgi:hypothetical protein
MTGKGSRPRCHLGRFVGKVYVRPETQEVKVNQDQAPLRWAIRPFLIRLAVGALPQGAVGQLTALRHQLVKGLFQVGVAHLDRVSLVSGQDSCLAKKLPDEGRTHALGTSHEVPTGYVRPSWP